MKFLSLSIYFLLLGCSPRLIENVPLEPILSTPSPGGLGSATEKLSTPPIETNYETEIPSATSTAKDPAARLDPIHDQDLRKAVQYSKEDLAKRLQLNIEQIRFFQAEEITWRDASMGCPEPGVFYIQVLTTGYRILLSANNHLFSYHTDKGETIILCELDTGVELSETTPPNTIGTPWIFRD